MSVNIHMIVKPGKIKFLSEKFTPAGGKSELTVQEHIKNLIDKEIKRTDPSFKGASVVSSPPSPIGKVDFILYFLDISDSMVKKCAETVKNSCPYNASKQGAENVIESIDNAPAVRTGLAYYHWHEDAKGKRTYKCRVSEVYLDRFSSVSHDTDNKRENLAEGLARMGAHELAHQMTELGIEIDKKTGGLDPNPQLGGFPNGPLTFPNGKQLPNKLVDKMKKKIQFFQKLP